MSSNGPTPGWYPDPWMPNGMRWWDGAAWTGYAAWARHPAFPQEAKERSILPWAKLYPVALGLVAVVGVTLGPSALSSLHHWFHQYDHWIHISTSLHNGQPVPKPPSFPFRGSILALDLIQLPTEALVIVFLVWIYRSALVAQSLGYPAPWSPGWSVGVWLIPIVNFWMPARALRSLLPSDHPTRAWVWPAWSLYLVGMVFGWVGLGLAVFGSGGAVSWVFIGGSDAAVLAVSYLLFRYLGTVGSQHRTAVEALK